MNEDGTTPANSVFHINVLEWLENENDAPYIDHMHLDDTTFPGEEWLFGSSKSRRVNIAGDFIWLWKVKLDVNHDPDPTTLTVFNVKKDAM